MFKRTLSVFLVLLIACSAFLITPASALNGNPCGPLPDDVLPEIDWDDYAVESTDGQYAYIENEDGTVDFHSFRHYPDNPEEMTVPAQIDGKKVKSILDLTLIPDVKTLIISEGIEKINGELWGIGGSQLERVIIPDSVTFLEDRAFYGNPSLKSVTVGSGIKTLNTGAFDSCDALEEIILKKGVEAISQNPRKGYISVGTPIHVYVDKENPYLTSVDGVVFSKDRRELIYYPPRHNEAYTIPEGTEKIGEYAFRGEFYRGDSTYSYVSVKKISFPSTLISIGENAFENTDIEAVHLPKNVKSIAPSAFHTCYSLKEISVEEENPYFSVIDSVLFSKDQTQLVLYPRAKEDSFYTVPDGVVALKTGSLSGKYYLTELILPDSVEVIEDGAVSGNSQLKTLHMSQNLREIGSFAFSGIGLSTIDLPPTLESIGYAAFYRSSIREVTLPSSLKKLSASAFEWSSVEKVKIEASLSAIGTETFSVCHKLKEITLPEGLTYIGPYAFYNCAALQSIYIPDSVTDIDATAFQYDDIILQGSKNSYAKKYAEDYGFTFEEITKESPARSILEAQAELSELSYIYDGTRKQPVPTLKIDGKTLAANRDYTVRYENNLSVGTAKAIITGIGQYTDTLTLEFSIVSRTEAGMTFELGEYDPIYSGTEKRPAVRVFDGTRALTEGRDYVVVYSNNVRAGVAAAKVSLMGNYRGSFPIDFEIEPKDLSSVSLSIASVDYMYDGSEKRPSVMLKDGAATLQNGRDFTLSFKNNINAGDADITITGTGNYKGQISRQFSIAKRPINSAELTLDCDSFLYDGKEKTPAVSVKLLGRELSEGSDYTVSYSSNISAGVGSVTVYGANNYSGSASQTFRIIEESRDISRCEVLIEGEKDYSANYTGFAQKPSVTVRDGSTVLTEGTDFSLSYSENINAGTALITVSGQGRYTGSRSASFKISPIPSSEVKFSLSEQIVTYDGTEKRPLITAVWGGYTLAQGKDYSLSYQNNINPGKGQVTVKLFGNFYAEYIESFIIMRPTISSSDVTLSAFSVPYNGHEQKPSVSVTFGSKTLKEGVDYSLSYRSNINVGTAYVTVTPIGIYGGDPIQKSFNITKKSITACLVSVNPSSFSYDGSAKEPSVTVFDQDIMLKEGEDYTISYENNTSAGTAKVVLTGQGNYTGCGSCKFYISGIALISSDVSLSASEYNYTGKAVEPTVTVKSGSKTLNKGIDYTVSYENNINPGSASLTVTGQGNYTGAITKTFRIKSSDKLRMVWGKSNWAFTNSSSNLYYGSNKRHIDLINSEYLNALKNIANRSPYYFILDSQLYTYGNTEYERIFGDSGYINRTWGGSCYGMSTLVVLGAARLIPYSEYTKGATSLHDLGLAKDNSDIASLITYYHMSQKRDEIQYNFSRATNEPDEATIKTILANINDYGMCIICFNWDDPDSGKRVGHAVVGYDHVSGSWTYGGKTYDRCIKICDPNTLRENSLTHIYYHSKDYSWTIPGYNNCVSSNNARLTGNPAGIDLLNGDGYLSQKTSSFNTAALDSSYANRLTAYDMGEDAELYKACESNGEYFSEGTSEDMVREEFVSAYGDEIECENGYTLRDTERSYLLRQTTAPVDLELNHLNRRYLASGSSVSEVVFDENYTLRLKGADTDYSLSITSNSDLPTDWFTLSVKGDHTDCVTLSMTPDGYLLSSDHLSDVTVSAHNAQNTATLTFSTDCDSALLYERNETSIGVRVDTDSDGIYETELSDKELISLSSFTLTVDDHDLIYDGTAVTPGVSVSNGEITLTRDTDYTVRYYDNDEPGTALAVVYGKGDYAGVLAQEYVVYESGAILGDADQNGIVNVGDATYIQMAIARMLTDDNGVPIEYGLMDKSSDLFKAADADQNGTVNVGDATVIQMFAAHMEVPAGIGEPIGK